jgi:hypothetical protein
VIVEHRHAWAFPAGQRHAHGSLRQAQGRRDLADITFTEMRQIDPNDVGVVSHRRGELWERNLPRRGIGTEQPHAYVRRRVRAALLLRAALLVDGSLGGGHRAAAGARDERLNSISLFVVFR